MNETPQSLLIAVREFIALARPAGDIDSSAASPRRAQLGSRIHREIQDSRPEGYRREVAVRETFSRAPFTLTLHGRIDGITVENDRTIVEEIKSTGRPLAYISADPDGHHFLQGRVYAALLARRDGLDRVRIRLTYADLDAANSREFERDETAASLNDLLDEMLDTVFTLLAAQARRRKTRDDSIPGLPFPFPAWRSGQHEMAEAVRDTLASQGRILIEAPTGTGKTIAALYPALQSLSRGEIRRIFYLTARGTGADAPRTALAHLQNRGLRQFSVELTARDKACVLPSPDCRPQNCPRAAGYYTRLPEALNTAMDEAGHFTPQRIRTLADFHDLCPFELALDLSTDADLIIGDVNYLFDPAVRLRRHFEPSPKDAALLCDEAHQLPDRVRSSHTATLNRRELRAVMKELPKNTPLRNALNRLDRWLKNRSDALKLEETRYLAGLEIPADFSELLEQVLEEFEGDEELRITNCELRIEEKSDTFDPVSAQSLRRILTDIQRLLPLFDDDFRWLEQSGREGFTVTLLCLHPGGRVDDALERVHSAVLFSATLTPEDYYRTLLNIEPAVPFLRLDSPFPRDHLLLLETRGLSLRYRDRSSNAPRVAALLAAVAAGRPGHTLAFFPSHAYLAEVAEQLFLRNDDIEFLLQPRTMDPEERTAFLDRFAGECWRPLLGLAVMGGIFGESVDLPGDHLTTVVVVGTGLPAPDPERDLIREYYETLVGDGFHFAYTWPGFRRVVQAAGRLIRTETDRGVLALVDDRFADPLYRDLKPAHWPDAVIISSPREASRTVRDFWNRDVT